MSAIVLFQSFTPGRRKSAMMTMVVVVAVVGVGVWVYCDCIRHSNRLD